MTRKKFLHTSEEKQLQYIQDKLHLEILPKILEHIHPKNRLIGKVTAVTDDNLAIILPIDCKSFSVERSFFDGATNRGMLYDISQFPNDAPPPRKGNYVCAEYRLDTLYMKQQEDNLPLKLEPNSAIVLNKKKLDTFYSTFRDVQELEQEYLNKAEKLEQRINEQKEKKGR